MTPSYENIPVHGSKGYLGRLYLEGADWLLSKLAMMIS